MLLCAGAVSPVPSAYVSGLVEALRSDNEAGRIPAASQLMKDRRDLVSALTTMAESREQGLAAGPELDPKYLGVRLLGDLRAAEAVDSLMGLLDYRVIMTFGGYGRTHGYGPTHPAAEALAKIGKPASKAALNRLVDASDPEKARALVWILTKVEGPDLARYLISKRMEHYEVGPPRGNLERALALVNEMDGK